MNKNFKIFLALMLAIAIAPSVIYKVDARITTAGSTDAWCVGAAGFEVCVDSSGNFIATTDSNQDLGTSSLRWSTVYADVVDAGTTLTFPDGSVTTAKIADGSVTTPKMSFTDLPAMSIGCVTTAKLRGTCTNLTAATGLCNNCVGP